MDDPNPNATRLVPARPDMGEAKKSGFLPRLPWRYIALAAALLGVIIGWFNWRQEQRAVELRAELRRVHGTELKEARQTYEASLARLARLIGDAADAPTTSFVDPSLQLQTLHESPGLYLRLPLSAANSPQKIAEGAREMDPDWIPSCLGLAPTTARELYEIGAFLLPEFVADLDQEDLMNLRVRRETLRQRTTKDMHALHAAMQAPWFMLVLQEGESRSDDPVRVFVWDLPREKLLLRARVRAQGILLTSRILSRGVETTGPSQTTGENGAVAANDCSIASALKREIAAARP